MLDDVLGSEGAGAGFTQRFAPDYFLVEDQVVGAAGVYAATFPLSVGCGTCAWQAAMAAFAP